jgi:cellulose synthase/poly-beta-1,6-N-acetylglucosamine synthase-like glycosyltransferase
MARWDELNQAVQSCREQVVSPEEILLVIDKNQELYERAVSEIAGVRVLQNRSTKGLSGARNTGVASSIGDVVVFLDDDAFADPDWLERLLAPLADPLVSGVGGWIIPEWDGTPPKWLPETFYWVLGCSYRGLPATGQSIRNPIGASMAIRRDVFLAVGGFTSGIGRIGTTPLGCEETELSIRYAARFPAARFVLVREAIVHHHVPASRLTWRYFRSRCWAEGLSKAAVASLAGAGSALSSERSYVTQALPRELLQNVQSIKRDPRNASIRSVLMFAGSLFTLAGYVRGRISVRRTPLTAGDDSLRDLISEQGDIVDP